MNITVQEIAYHRNGIAGEGFHVVRFTHARQRMLAIVFATPGQCAVLDATLLADNCISMASGNAWRGDMFEPALRQAITRYADE